MDKESALRLTKDYLVKVRKNNIDFSEAWLFGSFAIGNNHENSDIDLAIVFSKSKTSFDTEVKLMTLRTGEETLIEPHPFDKEDFVIESPVVFQILKNGIRINV